MNKLRVYPKKQFWRLYWVVLVLSLILDLIWLYLHAFHYHFQFQYLPQFFAILGLFGCMLLILIAKALGIIIVVDEDYYQENQGDRID